MIIDKSYFQSSVSLPNGEKWIRKYKTIDFKNAYTKFVEKEEPCYPISELDVSILDLPLGREYNDIEIPPNIEKLKHYIHKGFYKNLEAYLDKLNDKCDNLELITKKSKKLINGTKIEYVFKISHKTCLEYGKVYGPSIKNTYQGVPKLVYTILDCDDNYCYQYRNQSCKCEICAPRHNPRPRTKKIKINDKEDLDEDDYDDYDEVDSIIEVPTKTPIMLCDFIPDPIIKPEDEYCIVNKTISDNKTNHTCLIS